MFKLRNLSRKVATLSTRHFSREVFRKQGYKYARISPFRQFYELYPSLQNQGNRIFELGRQFPVNQESMESEEHARLSQLYLDKVAPEFEHIENESEREWLYAEYQREMGSDLPRSQQALNFALAYRSELFDQYLNKKFSSFKRYSLEGNEPLIPLLNTIFAQTAKEGVDNCVLGMPHRGRLNVLTLLLDYPLHQLLRKIQGKCDIPEADSLLATDDVTSHVACSNKKIFSNEPGQDSNLSPLTVSILHNPSHLQVINGVGMGKTRAKIEDSKKPVLNLQIHGDAAFSGQGVVYQAMSLNGLQNYSVGGSIHVICNNFIGFTTLPALGGRSTRHSGQLCKTYGIPIIHVNGSDGTDQIDSAAKAARLAVKYWRTFNKDILIDLHGYRKYGHNEVDEPAFTQPLHYHFLRKRGSTIQKMKQKLLDTKIITQKQISTFQTAFTDYLAKEEKEAHEGVHTLQKVRSPDFKGNRTLTHKWEGMSLPRIEEQQKIPQTGLAEEKLKEIARKSVQVPESLETHKRLQRTHIGARLAQLEGEGKVDWATAEAMALGSLVEEGYNVRLAGEDSQRGTFSQRHSFISDVKQGEKYFPLNKCAECEGAGRYEVVNSNLSEAGTLAYEYGYSLESPLNLNIWEAQFGDFAFAAQIVIDQFVTSGETKWLRQSGLVMLLPHGYDGMASEHSSGRIERFLTQVNAPGIDPSYKPAPLRKGESLADQYEYESSLCNIQVANITTPANYFHALRRQMLRKFRKPLIIAAPKRGLRLPEAVSKVSDMGVGTQFQPILVDEFKGDKTQRVIICSGRIFFDIKKLAEESKSSVKVIRVEQLAPFPELLIQEALGDLSSSAKVAWVQEQNLNSGAYSFARPHIERILEKSGAQLKYIGRGAIGATAVGNVEGNKKELEKLEKDIGDFISQI